MSERLRTWKVETTAAGVCLTINGQAFELARLKAESLNDVDSKPKKRKEKK